MDLDMEFDRGPKPKAPPQPKPAGGGTGRRVVVTTVLSAVMFGSGYVTGGSGFRVANLRALFGPKAAVASASAEPAPAPAAPEPTAPAPMTITPTRDLHAPPAADPAPAKPVKKAPAPAVAAAATPAPNPSAASKNAAANARPAAAAKQPTARFQPSTAKLSVLTTTLQNARSQLELYNLQHRDQYPTLAQLQKDWSVLTKPTDVDGKVMLAAGRSTLGPYLKQPPVNPITNSAKVAAPGKAAADAGWVYDEQTGLLKAVLPSHVIAPELDTESVERVGG